MTTFLVGATGMKSYKRPTEINADVVMLWLAAAQRHQVTQEEFQEAFLSTLDEVDGFPDWKHVLERIQKSRAVAAQVRLEESLRRQFSRERKAIESSMQGRELPAPGRAIKALENLEQKEGTRMGLIGLKKRASSIVEMSEEDTAAERTRQRQALLAQADHEQDKAS